MNFIKVINLKKGARLGQVIYDLPQARPETCLLFPHSKNPVYQKVDFQKKSILKARLVTFTLKLVGANPNHPYLFRRSCNCKPRPRQNLGFNISKAKMSISSKPTSGTMTCRVYSRLEFKFQILTKNIWKNLTKLSFQRLT